MTYSYQLYSSRNHPQLSETLSMLASLGYTEVEGFGGVFADLEEPQTLRHMLDEHGLSMPTAHFSLDQVESDPQGVIDLAKVLGIRHVIIPFLQPADRPADADGWAAMGQRIETATAPIRDAGLGAAYHNHDFEYADLGGDDRPIDLILSNAPNVNLEFDVAWSVRGGVDPQVTIDRWGDRIVAAHVKDIAPAGEKTDEDGWADVGTGTMDWPALLTALRATDCQHFVMEHDKPSDHERFAATSIRNAKAM